MAKKTYSAAFKAKVVLEVLQEEQELSAIATKYNLNPNMLRNWKKEFLEKAASVFEASTKAEKDARRKGAALKKRKIVSIVFRKFIFPLGSRQLPGQRMRLCVDFL